MARAVGGVHPRVHLSGDAASLLPKEQVIPLIERGVPVWAFGLGAVEPEPRRALLGKELLPRGMFHAVHQVPVVKPSAATRFFVHVKADRVNHMQPTPGGHTGATDVPRVVGNLRLVQHNVEAGRWRAGGRGGAVSHGGHGKCGVYSVHLCGQSSLQTLPGSPSFPSGHSCISRALVSRTAPGKVTEDRYSRRALNAALACAPCGSRTYMLLQ